MSANGPNAFTSMGSQVYVRNPEEAVLPYLPQRWLSIWSNWRVKDPIRWDALSQWDGPELARKLVADGIVQSISADTVARILRSHKLKPWRHHLWLSADVPRDEHFAQQ